MSPAEARRRGLEARRALSPDRRRELSEGVCDRVAGFSELVPPGRLAGYLPLAEEVDISPLFEPWRRAGWTLHLPRILGDGAMEFAHWGPGERLVPNRFGVGEPSGPAVDVAILDVVFLPCVAVDTAGNRVGFGAGYYDRAVARGTTSLRVGVAFEAQVVGAIDAEAWDVPLDVLVTESGVRRTGRR